MSEKFTPAAKPEPEAKAAPATVSANPGESGDPAVHKLLADRQAAQQNRDALTPEPDKDAVKRADEALAAIDKQLAEYGYK
jgi:hypothetical protein